MAEDRRGQRPSSRWVRQRTRWLVRRWPRQLVVPRRVAERLARRLPRRLPWRLPRRREPLRGHPWQVRRPRRRWQADGWQADGRQASGRRPAARAPGARGGEGSPHGRPGGVRRTGPARAHHRHRARPWGPCPAEGPAREARSPGRQAPGSGRSLHRRGPRARLPSRPGRPCPCLPHRGRSRGGGRDGVRRRPLRRGAGGAACRQADERCDGLPPDHGRLPPSTRQPRAGDQAGQDARLSPTSAPRRRPR